MRVCSPPLPADPKPAYFYRPEDRPCWSNGIDFGRWPNASLSPKPDPHLFCRAAQALAARVYAVPVPALRHPTRSFAHIALARQVAMYLANVAGGVTLTDVGHAFGRDRTTVAHACALVEDRRDDPAIDLSLTLLEQSLRASFRLDGRGHRDAPIRSAKHLPQSAPSEGWLQ